MVNGNMIHGIAINLNENLGLVGKVGLITAYLPDEQKFAVANEKQWYTFSESEEEFNKRFIVIRDTTEFEQIQIELSQDEIDRLYFTNDCSDLDNIEKVTKVSDFEIKFRELKGEITLKSIFTENTDKKSSCNNRNCFYRVLFFHFTCFD